VVSGQVEEGDSACDLGVGRLVGERGGVDHRVRSVPTGRGRRAERDCPVTNLQ
jgi:hypothetical protein